MSLSWKDIVATVTLVLVGGLTAALMMGAFEDIEARWALATFVMLFLGGLTGLITGTTRLMQRSWSSFGLYVLSITALTITIVNAFLNSEGWFIAMTVVAAIAWIEFVGIDLFSQQTDSDHKAAGGAA